MIQMSSCCTLIFLHSNTVLAERSIRKYIRFSMQQLVKHSSSTPTCRKIVELRKKERKLNVEMASSSESTVQVLRDLDVSGSDGRTQWASSWLCRFLCTTNSVSWDMNWDSDRRGHGAEEGRDLFLYLLFLSAFSVGQIWGSLQYSSLQSTCVLRCFTSRLMQMGDMGNHAQDKTGWMLKMFGNHSSELLRSFIFKLRLALLIWKPLINEEQIAYLLHLHNQANFVFTNHAK